MPSRGIPRGARLPRVERDDSLIAPQCVTRKDGEEIMKILLAVTAVIEVGAGLALICFPSATVVFLLGYPLDAPAAVTLGRVTGVALFALGVANWLGQYDEQSCAARGLVSAMVLYNFGATVILGAAGIGSQPVGIALWPAVVLHTAMTAWCVARLVCKPTQTNDTANRNR